METVDLMECGRIGQELPITTERRCKASVFPVLSAPCVGHRSMRRKAHGAPAADAGEGVLFPLPQQFHRSTLQCSSIQKG
jgi:hypothetical protein